MKVLVFLSLLALAMGLPTDSTPQFYHEAVGIAAASKIKAAEEAMDFTGSRIVGGNPAALGGHPYLAGLVITLFTTQTSVCGAALVSNSRVATAAHCYFDGAIFAVSITVVLGSTTLFTGGVRHVTNTVSMHPGWSPHSGQNDVAVLTIENVTFNPVLLNINIPTGVLLVTDFEGMWAQASGFGLTNPEGQITTGQTKHSVWVEVISNAACAQVYPDNVFLSTLCTDHSAGQGPCHGDSGGPLAIITGGRNYLIGISSFFSSEGCLGGPSGWARVSSFAFWLESHLYTH